MNSSCALGCMAVQSQLHSFTVAAEVDYRPKAFWFVGGWMRMLVGRLGHWWVAGKDMPGVGLCMCFEGVSGRSGIVWALREYLGFEKMIGLDQKRKCLGSIRKVFGLGQGECTRKSAGCRQVGPSQLWFAQHSVKAGMVCGMRKAGVAA